MKKTIIGRREKIDLPDWGVTSLVAKVDTGARTSAIHVVNIQPTDDNQVSFDVVLSRKFAHKRISVTCPIKRETAIRSSSGETSDRYVVETLMRLDNVEKVIELTLVSRKQMLCRMLLGRSALAGNFIVDVTTIHVTTS